MKDEKISKITSKLNYKTNKIDDNFKNKLVDLLMVSFDYDTENIYIKKQGHNIF